jgi:hypothetical protein
MHPSTKQKRRGNQKKPVLGQPASRKQAGQHPKNLEKYAGEPHPEYAFTQAITPSCRPKIAARIVSLKIADRHVAEPHCLRAIPELTFISEIEAYVSIEKKPADGQHRGEEGEPHDMSVGLNRLV